MRIVEPSPLLGETWVVRLGLTYFPLCAFPCFPRRACIPFSLPEKHLKIIGTPVTVTLTWAHDRDVRSLGSEGRADSGVHSQHPGTPGAASLRVEGALIGFTWGWKGPN